MIPDAEMPQGNDNKNIPGVSLRRRAEWRIKKTAGAKPPLPFTKGDMQKLIHELQVRQIEMEIQNAELLRARNNVENELKRFTELYNFAPFGYFTLDNNGTIRDVNLTGATLLGQERTLLVERRFQNFVSAGSLPAFDAFIRTVFGLPKMRPCCVELTLRGDPPIVVYAEAQVPGSGRVCLVAATDITSRKLAEDTLRNTRDELEERVQERTEARIQSECRLSNVINHLPDAALAIDCGGKVVAWNRAIEVMTGVSAKDMLGKGDHEYSLPFYNERRPILIDLVFNDNEEVRNRYPFVIRKGDRIISEIFIQHLNGGKGAYLWFIAFPLCDTDGNITGAIESIRELTERRQVDLAL